MDLNFTAAEREFRDEVRTWLRANVPVEERPHEPVAMRAFDLEWQRRQYDGGWAGIAWPTEFGGRGLSTMQQLIWFEEYALAGAPWIGACFVGINHGGPTLIARGNDAQKSFHLPRILRGDVVWCQGFSEPNAGSDLASLTTRAVVDGDELVVTGQKIWTSFADVADWQELLVRTDPDALKHKGITWAICDMHSPGIEIRPIATMARVAEFCEVFYNEVRIPLSNVVGDVNDGWSVAMSTLSFERGTGFMAEIIELSRYVEELIEEAKTRSAPGKANKRPAIADDELARRLAMARAGAASLRAMTYRAISRNERNGAPGPEASMLRLLYSTWLQATFRLSLDVLGPDALEFKPMRTKGGWSGTYLRSYASTIAGGTSEVQRNIIGERLLGLPR
ncbi:MAG: acyl-CoA dehydrogenase family protein [Acidimicrobiia bacterium]